ncbi:hypothetical protein CGRA01v4_10819 [Colletotrichum graminicola]|nr:hypothetical protein CGRA01v4_10819 [Colletotrichum graminicola]
MVGFVCSVCPPSPPLFNALFRNRVSACIALLFWRISGAAMVHRGAESLFPLLHRAPSTEPHTCSLGSGSAWSRRRTGKATRTWSWRCIMAHDPFWVILRLLIESRYATRPRPLTALTQA